MNDYWLHWVCICIRDENVERKTHGGSNTSDCWAGNSCNAYITAGRETTHKHTWRWVRSAPGGFSIRMCSPIILPQEFRFTCVSSCTAALLINTFISWRQLWSNNNNTDWKKPVEPWFCQRYACWHINNNNNQVCRKANETFLIWRIGSDCHLGITWSPCLPSQGDYKAEGRRRGAPSRMKRPCQRPNFVCTSEQPLPPPATFFASPRRIKPGLISLAGRLNLVRADNNVPSPLFFLAAESN